MINHYGTNFSVQTNVSKFYELRRLPHSSFFFFGLLPKNQEPSYSTIFTSMLFNWRVHFIYRQLSGVRYLLPLRKKKCEDVKGGGSSSSRNCLFVLINVPASHEGRNSLRKRSKKDSKRYPCSVWARYKREGYCWFERENQKQTWIYGETRLRSSCPVEGRYCGPKSVSIPVISLFRADNALTPARTSILWTSMHCNGKNWQIFFLNCRVICALWFGWRNWQSPETFLLYKILS